ncbi:MAG: type III pantothenate kinase [Eubacteriales bacterium]|nr:type III pantothenate kinase [Eubacteriales bacterium]
MILAIDIGNTNIVIGGVEKNKTFFIERVSTVHTKTELEYAIDIKNILDINEISPEMIEGGIVCSVVPQITNSLRIAAEKILKKEILVVGPGLKTGLNILIDFPGQLGSDLVADSVAGVAEYPCPQIIFDMGTATTVCVIDSKKNYIGGMIYPGLRVSLDALTARAAQLQGVGLDFPKRIVGKNTIDCMKSGILYSNASAIDGIIQRIQEELGEKATVIATGGLAKKVVPLCKEKIILDEDLLLKGMLTIYEKNIKKA